MCLFSSLTSRASKSAQSKFSANAQNTRPIKKSLTLQSGTSLRVPLPDGFDATRSSTFSKSRHNSTGGPSALMNACLDDFPLERRRTVQFDDLVTEHSDFYTGDVSIQGPTNPSRLHHRSYSDDGYSSAKKFKDTVKISRRTLSLNA